MATPIGHGLAGLAAYVALRKPDDPCSAGRRAAALALLAMCFAIAPDLDFIPGILVGRPALYHHGVSHSLGFCLLGATIGALLFRKLGRSFAAVFVLLFVAYGSHLVVDLFGPDGRPPTGIPMFWPLSDEHFHSPVTLLVKITHSPATDSPIAGWINGVVSWNNLLAITVEVLLIGPFVLLAQRLVSRIRSNRQPGL
jgi:inner membrane protein